MRHILAQIERIAIIFGQCFILISGIYPHSVNYYLRIICSLHTEKVSIIGKRERGLIWRAGAISSQRSLSIAHHSTSVVHSVSPPDKLPSVRELLEVCKDLRRHSSDCCVTLQL